MASIKAWFAMHLSSRDDGQPGLLLLDISADCVARFYAMVMFVVGLAGCGLYCAAGLTTLIKETLLACCACAVSGVLMRMNYNVAAKVLLSLMVPVACFSAAYRLERSLDLLEYSAWMIVPAVIFRNTQRSMFFVTCLLIYSLRILHIATIGNRTDLVSNNVRIAANSAIASLSLVPMMLLLVLYRHAREMQAEHDIRVAQARSLTFARTSHEIRTPLNSMLGLVDLLAATDLSAKQRHAANLLVSCGMDLLHIVNDTMDMSQLEAKALELKEAPASLSKVVEETTNQNIPHAAVSGSALQASCPPDLNVRCDANRVRQVLRNLIGNAIKFCKGGEIRLVVTKKDLTPTAHSMKDVLVKFSVFDDGLSIPEAMVPTIFDVYTQCENAEDAWVQGTGLGLLISKHLVEYMGGTVSLEPQKRGTAFHAEIPFQTCDLPPPVPEPLTEKVTIPPSNLKILLVDDNVTNLVVLRALLKTLGYMDVRIAKSGDEAVNMFSQDRRINVVLVDLHMPVMDGLETTRRIRSIASSTLDVGGTNDALPAIYAVSATVEESEKDKCRRIMDGFMPKPITKVRLKRVMADIVGRVAVAMHATGTMSCSGSDSTLESSVDLLALSNSLGTFSTSIGASLGTSGSSFGGSQTSLPLLQGTKQELQDMFASEWY